MGTDISDIINNLPYDEWETLKGLADQNSMEIEDAIHLLIIDAHQEMCKDY